MAEPLNKQPLHQQNLPRFLKDFLFYMLTIRGRSQRTVDAYLVDLRTYLRFLKRSRGMTAKDTPFEEISISDVNMDLIRSTSLSDAYEFLNFALSQRDNNANTRARKASALRSFYNYLTNKANLLEENPMSQLETPNVKKTLPKYLSLEESLELIQSVNPDDDARDYCILTLFLNCGMRLSELVGLDLSDVKEDTVKVTGKGDKERVIYLNDACKDALERYLAVRGKIPHANATQALFPSNQGRRISARRVQQIVSESLKKAGLDGMGYSTHKLRHTAATLMYQYGKVDIRLLKEILGHVSVATTEIYTHVSSEQMKNAVDQSPLARVTPASKTRKPKADTFDSGED